MVERGEVVAEGEPAGAERLGKQLKKETTEQAGEDANGEEEAGAAADPAVAVGSNAATGDDAVQVGVQLQSLPPGMQDGNEADLSAEVLGVGGEGAQSAGGGTEQQGVDNARVLEGEGGDRRGKSEDQVEVGTVRAVRSNACGPRRRGPRLGTWGSDGCGRSDSKSGGGRRGGTARSGHRGRRCGSVRWRT